MAAVVVMLTFGILAHVDAGKTTLSESVLYATGAIRRMGRVDNRDTAMDTHELEKQRGITIFSNRAVFRMPITPGEANADAGRAKNVRESALPAAEKNEREFVLLDTPGHADFSAETERTLNVLDYAVLVVSGPEGVQSHTLTLWKLLEKYGIPVFIFVNKMDRCPDAAPDAQGQYPENVRAELIRTLREKLSPECAELTDLESIATCEEGMLEEFLETGSIRREEIADAIAARKLFPVCFGSALKAEGVSEFLTAFAAYTVEPDYDADAEFSAKVYKITHDEKHNRLTHLKIMSGRIAIRDKIGNDKINAIYVDADQSGASGGERQEAFAGEIVAVGGLSGTFPGQGIGCADAPVPVTTPVMVYRVELPGGVSPTVAMEMLREIEEENPELAFSWDERSREISVHVMGGIQLEVLHEIVKENFGMEIRFGAGSIVYKETITNVVEGIGHFEPLRHYAEVHLLMEPGPRGSGVAADSDVSTDELPLNWQRLVMTHILERTHAGVLTGSELTDVKITVKAGRWHHKHTEGGDFRQATYRGIRQGLMQADSLLLEPYYDFVLELPMEALGRAMTDIESRSGKCEAPEQNGNRVTLRGFAPVSCLWDYQNEVNAYTAGYGTLALSLRGYDVCHNPEEVIAARGYDPDSDLRNPSASVFCAHGSGMLVPWDQVKEYMHVESIFALKRDDAGVPLSAVRTAKVDEWIDSEEVDAIIKKTTGANAKNKAPREPKKVQNFGASATHRKPQIIKPEYLLVDGYNIIFAWPELRMLVETNIDAARLKLMDIVSNYAGFRGIETAVVFDAYRVQNHKTETLEFHNIHVVYTATAETADHYIERFTHKNASQYAITVATSDGIEQIIIRSQGCRLMTASAFYEEVKHTNQEIKDIIAQNGSL